MFKFQDKFPKNISPINLDPRCNFQSKKVTCDFGNWKAKYRENFEINIKNNNDETIDKKIIKSQKPILSGKANNPLLSTNFTLENFKKVFYENNFVELLLTTFYFTFFGTVGAIIFGILAAQLVNQKNSRSNLHARYFAFSICGSCCSFSLYLDFIVRPK